MEQIISGAKHSDGQKNDGVSLDTLHHKKYQKMTKTWELFPVWLV
jgi:hypothetical protein